ncbi:methionyl-tRNA formyltransferase [Stieleria sp. TO1_6]|uniref:methionyl-tRNA formyltransferase n=1 Tax=Stieleria tagensis TaxID=2956795 RepID=UPI00209B0EF0|nr:methionyl-tRNA formyltransferase [Stieleria tagensis]MCO8123049.1 methionyl-tRNA formyltransferase [Stieleria tagensis]
MGTGPFAVPSFDALRSGGHEIAIVVTKPEPPVKSRKGPPPAPTRSWAEQHSLPIFDPLSINDPQAIEQLKSYAADLMVVCDYGQILKPAALESTRLGGINLHGSLLPAYRGAAPVQRALLSGDAETGVSVIHMTPRLDGGPILGTRTTAISDQETSGQLEERLSHLGVELVLQCIEQLTTWDGRSALGNAQDADQVTKAPRLSKREAEIDWNQPSKHIDCLVRGMQPWPIAYSMLKIRDNKPALRLAILKVSQSREDVSDLQPGQIAGQSDLIVATADGALKIETLRPAGKRDMSGEEFLRGYQLPKATSFQTPDPTRSS